MKTRQTVMRGVWIAALACGGCAGALRVPEQEAPDLTEATNGGQLILSGELDELTRAFADRYVGLLASTCDALRKDNPDPVQRREAQELMLNCATNVYDIASNADAFTRMLDLVVVTTLVSQVWIDDDRAWDVFGDRGEVLVRALHHGRVEAWALAAQILRPEQLDLMDYLLWDWRQHNPEMVRVAFVRFSNFAIGRGKSANAEVLAAGGLLANVGQAGQAVAEARLLTERMFYLAKRYPTLLRWQVEGAKDDIVATPEVSTYLTDVHRLTEQVEQLPRNVAAERQAIIAALDDRNPALRETLAQMRGAIADANAFAASVGQTSHAVNEMLKTADGLAARFDSPDTPPAPPVPRPPDTPEVPIGAGPSGASEARTDAQSSRPFDIREYTEAVKELGLASEKTNDLLQSSSEAFGSLEWERLIKEVNQSADGRMEVASEQSRLLVKEIFRGTYLAIGLLFGSLILYRVTAFLLARRLRGIAPNARAPRQTLGAVPEAGPTTRAGREGGKEESA